MTTLLQVALGGAVGSVLRWLVGLGFGRAASAGVPLGILAVNVAGSFLMGACVVVLARWDAGHLSPLVLTGLLGGFTTFSAFSLDSVTLIERGEIGAAALYVGLSVGLSVCALAAGMWLGRGLA